jgi:hypothetical protein
VTYERRSVQSDLDDDDDDDDDNDDEATGLEDVYLIKKDNKCRPVVVPLIHTGRCKLSPAFKRIFVGKVMMPLDQSYN